MSTEQLQQYQTTADTRSIEIGDIVTSRKGAQYTVTGIISGRHAGFILSRGNGKTVRISHRMCLSTLKRLQGGESLAIQQNASKGGISYTVAIETGVLYALEGHWTLDIKARCYTGKV